MNEQPFRSITPYGAWAEAILGWRKPIREDAALGRALVRCFQLATEWLPEYTYERAWFGVQDDNINILVGNMWLLAMGRWRGGELWLLTDDARFYHHVTPSMARYQPLGFAVYKWEQAAEICEQAELWQSYANAGRLIWDYPISRQAVPTTKRGKQKLSALMEMV